MKKLQKLNSPIVRKGKLYFLTIWLISLFSCKQEISVAVKGELKKWHTITLVFNGPETSEMNINNPFLNYRLDVKFSNGEKEYLIPGFYAANGNAAETNADSGNKWMVRFTPDQIGEWNYAVSFKEGKDIAISSTMEEAKSAGFMDGYTDKFVIKESDKQGIDNRAKGRLEYIGESYLRFAETEDYFIKLGVDAPENLLAYKDFDATPNVGDFLKSWAPHSADFPEEATPFVWQKDKGKNLMGAIKYLASEELNVFSFLTFNVDGDDRNVFPHLLNVSFEEYEAYANNKDNKEAWQNFFHKTRFDISKLDQWERIFEFAETQGMFLHFKTHETETDHLMDNGVFGREGKLYYRELIARFGHHLAINWNLGEENNQPIEEVIKVAEYVQSIDAYKHHLVVHTFPNRDDRYAELIGNQSPLTGASLQLREPDFRDVHERVLKWRTKSDSTGKKWALSVDEPGNAKFALLPDAEDSLHNDARSKALYGTLMAGGFGVEWYFGYNSPNSDLTCEDFRSRDLFWDQNRYAKQFFTANLPFWEMQPADDLTQDNTSYCLAKTGDAYAVYLPEGLKTTAINIGESQSEFYVRWFDPLGGGELIEGTVPSVMAKGIVDLGFAPRDIEKDWLVLIKKQ